MTPVRIHLFPGNSAPCLSSTELIEQEDRQEDTAAGYSSLAGGNQKEGKRCFQDGTEGCRKDHSTGVGSVWGRERMEDLRTEERPED